MNSSLVSIAPMMDWTDKHCRYFYRLISKNVQLYTEMITTKAILRGDKNRLLDFNAIENPLVLQLGGSDPKEMAACALIAQDWGYDEVNINVGCPSDRVLSGSFGACLMKEPNLVAQCVESMTDKCEIPVTVKHRIGIDDMESYDELSDFVFQISNKGCQHFIVHARKAWLKGLSPKENRTIPPLNYSWVYQLKKDFPPLKITINGGIESCEDVKKHLELVDGVMMGRSIYHNPFLLREIDKTIFDEKNILIGREQILKIYMTYIEKQSQNGVPIRSMTRHILGLYHGEANAKLFRRLLSGKIVGLDQLNDWFDFKKNSSTEIKSF
ncbi:MAG: tRNA dihydrouridine(20/20a) synthase DusA [Thiotrichales bacterium]|jgi:tRNA-dihydrouridine synthase A|nr:tRNA dihydrouridine(20/20a) synthase DusA [Thiotrichales bacterium]MBT3854715.1 tRNA dihydrouridine(20/20a) synthase DusA [Thiotrichales bacterium]MBT4653399.1 tRNA dihydrouridine(20/20a) synthase DusA [Thiotrichales bacterium]MBT5500132.1 tRNA dihydrouridine(20/20a) synthase DusA [Thiotrichales bacterium]MBT7149399.1 tRNA dihydrouridine(20/20a) synthase DusA [Thiotrichales bacterium]